MAILFLLAALLQEPVSSTLYGPRFLAGEVGGSVTHQCFYSITPANKHDRKYWCKTEGSGVCYTIISTTGYTSKDYRERVSLEDIPQNGTFLVTMTGLKKSDTGTYRCGIGTTNSDLYIRLNLTVSADASTLEPIKLILGELHGSVTVLCPPGDTQGREKRFWCKVGRSSCSLIANTDGYVGKNYQGRISITPWESSGAFKILINDLKKEDSGLYRCGSGRLSSRDSSRMVALQVTTASALPKRPKFLRGTAGCSLSIVCHYDPKRNYEKKYLCRWKGATCSLLVDTDGFVLESYKERIQMVSSDQETGTYTVVMSHLREEDAGWYWCGAKNGHTEHTSSVKLLIQKETCSSQGPETSTLVKPTLSSPAASSTPTQRSIVDLTHAMGTITKSTITESTVTESTVTDGTVTDGTVTVSTLTESTLTVSTLTESTLTENIVTDGTVTENTITVSTLTESTLTESTSTLLPTASPSTFVTSPGEIYHQSSSGESHLLPVVLPALILLIFTTITVLILTKIKLRKETGEERNTTGNLEATSIRDGVNPVKEQTMEETPRPENVRECRTDSGKCSKPAAGKKPFPGD